MTAYDSLCDERKGGNSDVCAVRYLKQQLLVFLSSLKSLEAAQGLEGQTNIYIVLLTFLLVPKLDMYTHIHTHTPTHYIQMSTK